MGRADLIFIALPCPALAPGIDSLVLFITMSMTMPITLELL